MDILLKNNNNMIIVNKSKIIKELKFENEIKCFCFNSKFIYIGFDNKVIKKYCIENYNDLREWKTPKTIIQLWIVNNEIFYLDGFGDIYMNNTDLEENEFSSEMNLFGQIKIFLITEKYLIFCDELNKIKFIDKNNIQNIVMSHTYRHEKIINILSNDTHYLIIFEDFKIGILDKANLLKNYQDLKYVDFKLEENILNSSINGQDIIFLTEFDNKKKIYRLSIIDWSNKFLLELDNDYLNYKNFVFKIDKDNIKHLSLN